MTTADRSYAEIAGGSGQAVGTPDRHIDVVPGFADVSSFAGRVGAVQPVVTDYSNFFLVKPSPVLTDGSVLFASDGEVAQDNAKFFWDNTNDRLGIGTNAPSWDLHIKRGLNNSLLATVENTTSASDALSGFGATAGATVGYLFSAPAGYTGAPILTSRTSLYATNGVNIVSTTGDILFYTGGIAAGDERVRIPSNLDGFEFGSERDVSLARTAAGILSLQSATPVLKLKDTDGAGAAATSFIEFLDNADSRKGAIGDLSGSVSAITLQADLGDVIINAVTASTAYISFKTADTTRWQIDPDGHLFPITTNTKDIASSGTRIRSVFAGTSVLTPLVGNGATGMKVGAATSDLLGFYGVTPVNQPDAVADASGGAVIDSQARTQLNLLLARIRELGLIAT